MKTRVVTITRRAIDPMALYKATGRLLKVARDRAGYTQEQTAAALGITRTQWTNIEAGRTAIMLAHIYNFALLTKIPVRDLIPRL